MSSSNVHPNGRKRDLSENSQASIEQQLAQCQASCRQMEATLQATVAQLERSLALYDNLPSIYFTLNFMGVISSINSLGAERLGYTAEELIGQSIFSLVNVTTRSQFQDAFSAWMQQSTLAGNWQGEFSRSDGTLVWVNALARRSADPSNPEIFLVGEEIANFANQSLCDREQHFRRIFEQAAVGIVQTAISGQYLLVNQKFADILQYTVEELQEKTFQEITEPDDINSDRHQISRLLAGEISGFSIEKRYIRKNGSRIWVNLTRSLIRDSAGEPQYFISIIEDISERKANEEALRESEQRLAAIAANVPGVFYRLIIREKGRFSIAYVSAGLQDSIGIAAGEIIAHPSQIFKQIYPGDRQTLKKAIKFSVQTLARFRYEYRVIKTNRDLGMPEDRVVQSEKSFRQILEHGCEIVNEFDFLSPSGIRYYQSRLVPEFTTEEGSGNVRVESILSIARDITDLKQMQQSLQVARARLQYLLAKSPAVIYSCKSSGDYGATFVSENIAQIVGYEVQEFLEDSSFWSDRLHPDNRDRILADLLQIFETNHHVCEYQFQHKNGSYRWIYDERHLVRDADNNPLEIVGSWIDITDRKLAEEQLIRFSKAVASASDGIGMTDMTGQSIYYNQAFFNMFGYTSEQINAEGGWQVIFTDEAIARQVFDTILQKDSWSGEVQIRNRQGRVLDILLHSYAIEDNSENPIGLVSIYTDITERKRSLVLLQEREMRFRTLAETVTAAIFIFQGNRLRYVNSAAEVLTGYTREELLIGGAQLIHPQFLEFAANQIDEDSASLPYLQQQGQQRNTRCELKLLTKTGQERCVDFSVALMEYNGQPAVLSAAFDITDRKQAEESLKYRVQLEQLIGNISSQFLNLKPDEIDTGINEALKNLGAFMEVDRTYLYIFTDNETKIDRSHQWVAPGIEPKILELSNLPLNTLNAQTVRKDETLDAEDVRSPDVQATILVPLAVGGSTVGAIGCDTVLAPKIWTEDHISLLRIVGEMFVTAMERRGFERELQERAAELVRSNAELEQFAYIASHDLQEPLRTVMSYTQLLARRYSGQLDAKAERYMNFAVEGASRMQRLIEDLLAYSRVGTQAREFQSVDCVTAFEQALANLRMAIQESGAIITRNDLPTIQGDPTQFAQLLQNLIGNAIKYRGTEPPQIRVSAELLDNQWQFSISDNGIGIEAKHSDRIFQVFQRLHTREEYPGTGIGLAICKKIVERHGGRISLNSLPGEGSTFYFTIPNT